MKLAMVLTVAAMPVAAQEFTVPNGCTAFLTVQNRDCTVDHHFRCDADPAQKHRASFDETAMVYLGTVDAETQWISSSHISGGYTEKLGSNPVDPASFSELITTGADSYDFKTTSAEIGTTRYVGRDTLTGNTRVVDGVTLDETVYEITAFASDGAMIWSSKGNEYINRDMRLFFSGTSKVTTPTNTFDSDATPAQMIQPDALGFLSIKPKFGCGALMSAAPAYQENSHDNL